MWGEEGEAVDGVGGARVVGGGVGVGWATVAGRRRSATGGCGWGVIGVWVVGPAATGRRRSAAGASAAARREGGCRGGGRGWGASEGGGAAMSVINKQYKWLSTFDVQNQRGGRTQH